MVARPDQPPAKVQQLAMDELNTITGELGELQANRMAALAAVVEANDSLLTSSLSMLPKAGEPAAEQGREFEWYSTFLF